MQNFILQQVLIPSKTSTDLNRIFIFKDFISILLIPLLFFFSHPLLSSILLSIFQFHCLNSLIYFLIIHSLLHAYWLIPSIPILFYLINLKFLFLILLFLLIFNSNLILILLILFSIFLPGFQLYTLNQ